MAISMPDRAAISGLFSAETPATARLCVGIDPHPKTLQSWGLPDSPSALREFSTRIIQTCVDHGVGLVKPQVALFERLGVAGMSALAEVIDFARSAGVLVIADAKRGDIGSTMAGYAEAWLTPGGDFESDALTVSPFLGTGALEPAFEKAVEHHKTVFVLAATSNPEAHLLQSAITGTGDSVAQSVLAELDQRSRQSDTPGAIGAVIGATADSAERGVVMNQLWTLPVLAPGFGHQGAKLSDLWRVFGQSAGWVIPTVSRSVAGNSPDGLDQRVISHREELQRAHI